MIEWQHGATYSSLTRLWLSLSMKLPRLRVLFLRPKYDFLALRLGSFLPTLPPTQKSTVATRKQANAPQVKLYAYVPMRAS
jgi:hypothetical protein